MKLVQKAAPAPKQPKAPKKAAEKKPKEEKPKEEVKTEPKAESKEKAPEEAPKDGKKDGVWFWGSEGIGTNINPWSVMQAKREWTYDNAVRTFGSSPSSQVSWSGRRVKD